MHAIVEVVSQRATFLWGVERRFTLEPEPAAITKLVEGVLSGLRCGRGGKRIVRTRIPEGRSTMATKIAEVMTQRPRAVTAQTTVREAARLMEEEDVGSLPVVDDGARLIGIVTDRDVALRVVGRGLDSDTTVVGEVASRDVVALTPDHELDDALKVMAREQVRRVPIVVRENQLVGMLAQADIAHTGKEKTAGEVVEAISRAPRGPRVAGPGDGDSPDGASRRELAPDEQAPPSRDRA